MATLYLRSIPESIVREAKATAARRGMTLTALVTEVLTNALAQNPSGDRELSEDLQADRAWYEAHRDDLLLRYRGQYVAIAHQQVIDHDRDFGRLASRVFKRMGVRPVFMPKCIDGARVVHVPSPRIVRT